MRFEAQKGFPEDQRADVAALYWEAFSDKLGPVLGPPDKARAFFASILDPRFCMAVLSTRGDVLGVAGFKTREGALADGTLGDLQEIYGWFGGLWRSLLLLLLVRNVGPELLQMDGIFVSAKARGSGIGSVLLNAIAQEARDRGLQGVRLDVIDTNPRARALYERNGFVEIGKQRLGPFKWVFGYAAATRMALRF